MVDPGNHTNDAILNEFFGFGIDVFVGKIDKGFHVGEDFDESFPEPLHFVAKPTRELFPGRLDREIGPRRDEVHDRLRLGQVDLSIENGTLAEIARLSGNGTEF